MMRQTNRFVTAIALMGLAVGCSTTPKTAGERDNLMSDADAELKHFYNEDATLGEFVKSSAGYAVFPSVGKGGLIVGGTNGRGIVYQGGKAIGYAQLSKASIGAIAGGQTFSQIIVFQNNAALENFKAGQYAFAADASAVALKKGAATSAKYSGGVAVFVDSKGGLAIDASVGGQKFDFEAMK